MAESKSAALPLGYAPPMSTTIPPPRQRRQTDNVHRRVAQAIWAAERPRIGADLGLRDVVEIPAISLRQPVPQAGRRRPAERGETADIEQLLRRAVGPVQRMGEAAAETDDLGDERGELIDRHV